MESFDPADIERFRDIIARRLGLQFDDGKREMLADVLQQRLNARGSVRPGVYLESIGSAANEREEIRALASLLTVTETYFLRGSEQFQVLAEVALPLDESKRR